jgi:hypothetical protein
MGGDFYYNRDHEPITADEAGRLLMDLAARHVRVTALDDGVWVSTVFLVVDYSFGFGAGPPVLYETMAFGVPGGQEFQTKWCTLEEAEAGHDQVVDEVRAALVVRMGRDRS